MQKYKCIKKYPHGPEIGKEIHDSWEGESRSLANYPDYWELVSPIYKISSILSYDGDRILDDEENLLAYLELKDMNEFVPWVINSVLRISDDITFTVGDRVYYYDNTFIKWEIDNFHLREDGVMLARSKDNQMVETIDTICKVEPVSFRSYDNLELTEKSEYYVVGPRFNFIQNGTPQTYPSFTKNKTKYFVFANKENAINFIIHNKPCISIEDIMATVNLGLGAGTKLKELVKSKLEL